MRGLAQLVVAVLALVAVAQAVPAAADPSYPSRPIRLMLGFGPGGAADIVARVLAQRMGQIIGQQIVVENKAGAGTSLAAEAVARAPKDGYTLLLATIANPVHAVVSTTASFDFARDLAPVGRIGATPNLLTVSPSAGARTLQELIAIAKARPGELLFGSSGGVATPTHLSGELFNVLAGVRIVHVPYPGSAQALTDLLAGRIQIMFSPPAVVLQHVHDGTLIALAATDSRRSAIAPDVPTMAEAGLPGFETGLWYGLMAPAGTPRPIIDKLASALRQALASTEMAQALQPQGVELGGSTPEEFAAFIDSEMKRWDGVVRAAGLKK